MTCPDDGSGFHCSFESFPFGWEEADGFRGHVFLSSDNSTVVLSIKGTTLQGSTSKLDKYNDNLWVFYTGIHHTSY
jgi:putative lipase involved disintegration of autophagic bodies